MQVSQAVAQSFDVSVFQGSAVSQAQHPLGYEPGERRRLIVFLRQPRGNDTDMIEVERLMRRAGWRKAMLSLIVVLNDLPPMLDGDLALRSSYRDALETGGSVIVCGDTA
ncbi:MAG TPA: hypothetical protein VF920_07895 [Dongiaceae bacterium]